ncbi:MAG: DMT family transporter [Firmicutes bacterium]|nr:DMT family transporter [Bacillota bacterium]
MEKTHWQKNILLLLASLIWGCGFVAQSLCTRYIGPFTYVAIRSLLGGLFLLPCISLLGKGRKPEAEAGGKSAGRRSLLLSGTLCGAALCVATLFQQAGIAYTTVGKTGFITTLYIVFVPAVAWLSGKKPSKFLCIAVPVALAGIYFLCMNESISVNKGDVLVLLCALCYTGHILLIDRFAPQTDGVQMSCLQLFVCAALSSVPMLLWERPDLSGILAAAWPLLYSGILSCAVAYTLQILGQKNNDPTVSSLLLSLEAVFAAIVGWLFLQQAMSGREVLGCVLMFAAIILAQIPNKKTSLPGES